MACNVELLVQTDSSIALTLTDEAGAPVTGASVQLARLLDVLANAAPAGFTPPLAMPENPPASGIYKAVLSDTVALAALRKYELEISATLVGGQVVTHFEEIFAKKG